MTVSRVINNREGVGDETRLAVQEVIERLGYRPSGIARGLATQRTGTLGLVVPDVSNPFFSEVAYSVEQVASAEGYSVLLYNTEEDPQREADVLQALEEKRVEGVILCSSRLDSRKLRSLIERQPATVLVNRQLSQRAASPAVHAVMLDDVTGGRIATQHLIGRGHRQIGFLAGPETSYSSRGRARGYQEALQKAGLPSEPGWSQHCAPVVAGGYEGARLLLERIPQLTALFCYNDLVAAGALQACAALGRPVPESLAVVGFDDIPLAALVTPPLTTCRVSRAELGQQAIRLLLQQIRGETGESPKTVVHPELVIRLSAP